MPVHGVKLPIFPRKLAKALEYQRIICNFAAHFNEGGLNMELQTVKTEKEKLIPSGASMDGISIRRTGIAKVLWRKLNVEVPESDVIANGVNIYKG